MTFQQLRYLMEVYRTGSVSLAAEKLFVSRPSVSISINASINSLCTAPLAFACFFLFIRIADLSWYVNFTIMTRR